MSNQLARLSLSPLLVILFCVFVFVSLMSVFLGFHVFVRASVNGRASVGLPLRLCAVFGTIKRVSPRRPGLRRLQMLL